MLITFTAESKLQTFSTPSLLIQKATKVGPNASLGRALSFEFVSSQGKHNNNQNIIQSATIQPTSNTAPASTGLEIVPWKPVLDVIALQLWPLIVESRRQARIAELTAPVIVLGDVECQQSPTTSGLEDFEFQMGQIQPSPPREAIQEKQRGRKSTGMSLLASSSSSVSSLVESSVRRSQRVNHATNGFHEVRLAKNPSKKQKICGVVLIDESNREAGPLPIAILQG
jgi:hypothetical protein